jgi:geranylgeranyl diphosphate synthase, type II
MRSGKRRPFDGAAFMERCRSAVEEQMRRWYAPGRGVPDDLRKACLYAVMGAGKRLRPALVAASCKAAGGGPKDWIPAAVALEMIHNYSLVHDDLPCMDDDDYRRGRPTVHRAFGEAVAVLAGDALLTDAFAVASEGLARRFGSGDKRPGAVVFELAAAAGSSGMVGGQFLDTAVGGGMNRSRMERLSALKTGRLFLAAVRLGGLCAGAGSASMKRLERYGRDLGLAFQIADDIIDARAGKIEQCNYARLMGEKKAAARLEVLAASANREAAALGSSASALEWIAGFVAGSIGTGAPVK